MKALWKRFKAAVPLPLKRIGKRWTLRGKIIGRNARAALTWRGDRPAVYLHWEIQLAINPIWQTYLSHPPLCYAPYPVADLIHWISGTFAMPLPRKRQIIEAEHMLVIAEQFHRGEDRGWRPMRDWHLVFDDLERVNTLVASPQLRSIFTFSAGLAEHFKLHLDSSLWHKLDFAYPAFPAQDVDLAARPNRPFTILVIASRFSDKGLPEAFRAFEILRKRHGGKVRMLLVSQAIPSGYRLPEGIEHHDVPVMSPQFKEQVYRSADVLFLPNFGETAACFPEAYAFGMPVVTTRIHHGDEFVREGETGFLMTTPIFGFCEKLGREWRVAEDFLHELERMRASGALQPMIDEAVDYLDGMITGKIDIVGMGEAARKFHAEKFTPALRNQKLRAIYDAALRD